tara:strand:+ start:54 stop:260 length:207 start_codon:yes stop_codon:yes gene_type:complete
MNKKPLIRRLWKFQFPFIDQRLSVLAGIGIGLFVAKIWEPILYLDWYWYLLIVLLAVIKPLVTFFKQV